MYPLFTSIIIVYIGGRAVFKYRDIFGGHVSGVLLYHFELFGGSRVTSPLDGAEIGHCHGSHRPCPAVTSLFINYSIYWLTYWPKFKPEHARPKFKFAAGS